MLGRRLSRRVYTDGFAPRLGYLPWRVLSTTHTFAALPITVASSVVTPTFGPAIVPRGPATAATLVFDYENGGTITYSWATDILRSRNGKETRRALAQVPRETYDFATYLDDAAIRVMLSRLVVGAATASAFGVALEHESVTITGANAFTVTTTTTALLDWVYAGQSAIVLAHDGVTMTAGVIQSFTATTITLDVPIGSAGVAGARIMPVIPCYLDDTQSFGLYPANAGSYSLRARAAYFGAAGGAWPARGATVTTYTDPSSHLVYPVYDVPLAVEDSSPRAATVSGVTIADFGGVFTPMPSMATVDFMRQILHVIRTDADRQYLKAFMGSVLRTPAKRLHAADGSAGPGPAR
jgi:hypothetical protein